MALNGDFARQLFQQSDPRYGLYWGHDHWAALFAWGCGYVQVVNEPLLWHRFHATNASRSERFSLFRWEQLKRYLKAVHAQGPDHFSERYRLAKQQAERMVPRVRSTLVHALEYLVVISDERRDMHALPMHRRLRSAWQLHQGGVYKKYYNGWATMLRDLFL
jgi:hypothetical protein